MKRFFSCAGISESMISIRHSQVTISCAGATIKINKLIFRSNEIIERRIKVFYFLAKEKPKVAAFKGLVKNRDAIEL
ncbi:MAG: hypothetical protein ABIS12_07650 [Bacteroidia bacterium]